VRGTDTSAVFGPTTVTATSAAVTCDPLAVDAITTLLEHFPRYQRRTRPTIIKSKLKVVYVTHGRGDHCLSPSPSVCNEILPSRDLANRFQMNTDSPDLRPPFLSFLPISRCLSIAVPGRGLSTVPPLTQGESFVDDVRSSFDRWCSNWNFSIIAGRKTGEGRGAAAAAATASTPTTATAAIVNRTAAIDQDRTANSILCPSTKLVDSSRQAHSGDVTWSHGANNGQRSYPARLSCSMIMHKTQSPPPSIKPDRCLLAWLLLISLRLTAAARLLTNDHYCARFKTPPNRSRCNLLLHRFSSSISSSKGDLCRSATASFYEEHSWRRSIIAVIKRRVAPESPSSPAPPTARSTNLVVAN